MDWKKTTKIFTLCVLSAMTPLFAGGRRGPNGSDNHHGSHGRPVQGTNNVYHEGPRFSQPTNIYQPQGGHHGAHGRPVQGTSNVYYEGPRFSQPTNIYQPQGEQRGRLVYGTDNVYYEGSRFNQPTNIYEPQGEHHGCGAPTIVVQPRVVQSYQYTGQPLQVIYYVR